MAHLSAVGGRVNNAAIRAPALLSQTSGALYRTLTPDGPLKVPTCHAVKGGLGPWLAVPMLTVVAALGI
jgi:hypothetical protein